MLCQFLGKTTQIRCAFLHPGVKVGSNKHVTMRWTSIPREHPVQGRKEGRQGGGGGLPVRNNPSKIA